MALEGPGGGAMTSTRVITLSRWRHGFESRWGCHRTASQRPFPEGLEAFSGVLANPLRISRRSVALAQRRFGDEGSHARALGRLGAAGLRRPRPGDASQAV